mmetsp:Transcript_40019/g.81958  ORF Transcript_40019/g.81958 Transcript_40019/m.81958 type:complete len:285 (+) Transcript_40019:412-1266(+)
MAIVHGPARIRVEQPHRLLVVGEGSLQDHIAAVRYLRHSGCHGFVALTDKSQREAPCNAVPVSDEDEAGTAKLHRLLAEGLHPAGKPHLATLFRPHRWIADEAILCQLAVVAHTCYPDVVGDVRGDLLGSPQRWPWRIPGTKVDRREDLTKLSIYAEADAEDPADFHCGLDAPDKRGRDNHGELAVVPSQKLLAHGLGLLGARQGQRRVKRISLAEHGSKPGLRRRLVGALPVADHGDPQHRLLLERGIDVRCASGCCGLVKRVEIIVTTKATARVALTHGSGS